MPQLTLFSSLYYEGEVYREAVQTQMASFVYSLYTLESVFTSELQIKAKKLSVDSLTNF